MSQNPIATIGFGALGIHNAIQAGLAQGRAVAAARRDDAQAVDAVLRLGNQLALANRENARLRAELAAMRERALSAEAALLGTL